MLYYNYGGKPFTLLEFIDREVYELNNYSLGQVKKWMKDVNATDDRLCIWACLKIEDAARYGMPNTGRYMTDEDFQRHLRIITPELNTYDSNWGTLIKESNDGDGGFLLIAKEAHV